VGRSLEDWTLLGILVAVWGTGFLFIAIAVETLPPLTVAAARIAGAALVLLVAVRAAGLPLPRGRRPWAWFLVLGLFGNCLPFFAIGWGQERVASGLTGILMGINPLTTLVLAHLFVPGEDMTRVKSAGFLLGFAGIVMLAVLFGAVCYATNAILTRHMPPTHALVAAACTLTMASLVIGPVTLVVDRPWTLAGSAPSWWAVVWLGLVTTAGATIVYFRLVARAGPTFYSLINFLIPIVALLAGVGLRGEAIPGRAFAALALILGGLALARWAEPGPVAAAD